MFAGLAEGPDPMNKITREHYPVAKLPEELRKEFEGVETVRLLVEEESPRLTGVAAVAVMEARYGARLRKLASKAPLDFGAHRGRTTIEEAVARIRELRDEWDD